MFAAIAALLVAVGLYGVLSIVVRQRTAEIGVRMALGASPARMLRLVVGSGLRLSAAGIALGLVAALLLTRAITTMLVGVRPTDPTTFAVVGWCSPALPWGRHGFPRAGRRGSIRRRL